MAGNHPTTCVDGGSDTSQPIEFNLCLYGELFQMICFSGLDGILVTFISNYMLE